MNSMLRGRILSFEKHIEVAMSVDFGSHHADVDAGRKLDRVVAHVEAVGEHQSLAGSEVRSNLLLINRRLGRVGREEHDYVSPRGSFRDGTQRQTSCFHPLARPAFAVQADEHFTSTVAQVEGVRMSLGAVADNGDLLALNER